MRVLLLEDESELARLVAASLGRSGFSVDVARTIATGAEALRSIPYDALILDRRLPDGDGMQLLGHGRATEGTPTIMLTARDSLNARVDGLNRGADDYLTKPFEMIELIARLRAILRRPKQLSKALLVSGNLEFDTASRSLRILGQSVVIARREGMLIQQLLRRTGQVVTHEALDAALYGFDQDASRNAVEASVSRLRKLLTAAGADRRIHTVRGVGYCLAS